MDINISFNFLMNMVDKFRILIVLFVLILGQSAVSAAVYKLEGMVGGKYAIVIELEEHSDGFISGRYAYKSTLRKNGDVECSWLQINPSYEAPVTQWTIRDCKPDVVEEWYNVNFNDRKHLTARMKNTKGRNYDVSATVTASASGNPSTIEYFKSHIGDCPSDFHMFFDPFIQQRLEDLMGEKNFNYMAYIYQTQGGIEYTKGMFYGSAFMAHQCCDPATVWAYDTDNNSFYVWIRKDGKDYWWSESGNIPIKFREIVSERF